MKNRPLDAKQRFLGEDHRAFRDRIHIAFQAQLAQVVKERRVEQRLPVPSGNCPQIRQVGVVKAEGAEPLDGRRQAAGDGEAALKRRLCGKTGGTRLLYWRCLTSSSRKPW